MSQTFQFERRNGRNVFVFEVDDPIVARGALLDVPWLYYVQTPGHANTFRSDILSTFVVTGLPAATKDGSYPIELESGTLGKVGAVFRYSFPHGSATINVRTTLASLLEYGNTTTIVYEHEKEIEGWCGAWQMLCGRYAGKKAETMFEITDYGLKGQVKMSHTGPNAAAPRQREGALSYMCNRTVEFCVVEKACLIPCFWPLFPCLLCFADDNQLSIHTKKRITNIEAFTKSGPRTPSLIVPRKQRPVREGKRKKAHDLKTGMFSGDSLQPPPRQVMTRQGPGNKIEELNTVTSGVRVLEPSQEGNTQEKTTSTTHEGTVGGTVVYEDAIPVAQVAETRGEELERWFNLYKNGAITEEEYEAEKVKLLKDEE